MPPLERLVGLSVMRGFTRAVNEAMTPVVKQGAGATFHEDEEFAFTAREDADPPRAP